MQMQDYLPFFQDLAVQLYQITLELPVYAASLAVVVWLITAVFYSIRISALKGHINRAVKAGKEIQAALKTNEELTQQLQLETTQLQEQYQNSEAERQVLTERLDDLARQLTASIRTLADNADLGQQGLTAAEGLSTEALWQRFNAATSQLAATVLEERANIQALQQSVAEEQAKAEEKDQLVQAMQLRLDSQSQQLAKLTLAAEEHKLQLAAQQQSAQQQMAELDARYRSEISAMAANQAAMKSVADQVTKVVTSLTPEPVVNPVATNVDEPVKVQTEALATAFQAVSVMSTLEPKVIPAPAVNQPPVIEPVPAVVTQVAAPVSESSASSVAAEVKPAPVAKPVAKAKPSKPSASGGKLKGFFANAKETFKKMDQKLGSPGEQVYADSEAEPAVVPEAPAEVVVPVQVVAEPETKVDSQPKPAKQSKLGGLFGKLKR